MDKKEIVRQGYDKVSYAYRNERGGDEFSDYASWLAELTALVPYHGFAFFVEDGKAADRIAG